MKIKLLIEQTPPRREECRKKPTLSVEEKVRDACDLIESGHDSREEWNLIRNINNHLMKKEHLNKRQANILLMIQEIIDKYHRMDDNKVIRDPHKIAVLKGKKDAKAD